MNAPKRGFSRRELLIRSGVVGAAGLSLPAILAACGGDDGGGGGADELFVENWPYYIDPTEDGATGTIDRFVAASGVKTTYSEAYNDNLEYFAKIQPLLGTGKTIDPDIIMPTQWMAGRLRKLGWLEKLPVDKVPNAKNLEDAFKNPPSDPTGEYSLPWQAGTAGIAYNIDVTGRELKSVADLFAPEFKGKIGMLTEMRDTIGLLLLGLGINPSTVTSFNDAAPAFEQLEKAKADGQIRAFTGNDYMDDLSLGNFAACVGWSGDILQLQADNPSARFVIPEEGGTLWWDTMVVPKGAKNTAAAAKFMDYVYDPVQAAQITAWVQYMSPVKGVREELAKIDPELADDPLLFPDDATRARLYAFADLSDDVEAEFEEAFSAITGA
ncbi:MAG: ABC transporter substrate-binding protein [Ilumatobacteraceae bacterium]|jgi:spermidine/putrescine transport system substrate-binding protein|nr:spermidine/putrescine ABC transporter substrate-binding protein [Actinomycetota bacterium]MDA3012445.1 spermidine/putrescine ABC transporter substrate-binding protein [Actinomycetota bacterium]MDA3025314.1 spermidine/putrescine ABC transporter substrate-binding protein [Actinomycetota bacterium]